MKKILAHTMLLTVAIMLAMISYQIERLAYEAILPNMLLLGVSMAVFMALAFNASKLALAWVLARGRTMARSSAFVTKTLYVALSLLASVVVFSYHADAPNLLKVYKERRYEVSMTHGKRVEDYISRRKQEEQALIDGQARERRRIESKHEAKLAELKREREAEEKRTYRDSTEFRGPHYEDVMNRINSTEQEYHARVDQLNQADQQALDVHRHDTERGIQAKQEKRDHDLAGITLASVANNEAVQNRYLLAPVHLSNEILGTNLTPMHIALLLSLLATLAVEIGPLVLIVFIAKDDDDPQGPAPQASLDPEGRAGNTAHTAAVADESREDDPKILQLHSQE